MRVITYLFVTVLAFSMCRKKALIVLPMPEPVVDTPVITPPKVSPYQLIGVSKQITKNFGGYYVALPPDYKDSSQSYPLLLFLHGFGQMGNGKEELDRITFDGIARVIQAGRFPVSSTVGEKIFSFIVMCPQYGDRPTPEEIFQVREYAFANFRIDTNRVYLSGLSLGGILVTVTAAQYPTKFAAIVPIAGVAQQGLKERCDSIAKANLPVWELHNADDPMFDVEDARRFINYLISLNPLIPPRFTVFDKYGHDAWSTALDSSYKEEGKNIYEWMLQYSR